MNHSLAFKVLCNSFLTQRRLTDLVVKFAVSPDLTEEKGYCGEAHPEDRDNSKLNFFSYLVLSLGQRHKVRIWEMFALELLAGLMLS